MCKVDRSPFTIEHDWSCFFREVIPYQMRASVWNTSRESYWQTRALCSDAIPFIGNLQTGKFLSISFPFFHFFSRALMALRLLLVICDCIFAKVTCFVNFTQNCASTFIESLESTQFFNRLNLFKCWNLNDNGFMQFLKQD